MSNTINLYRIKIIDPNSTNYNRLITMESSVEPTMGPNQEQIDPEHTLLLVENYKNIDNTNNTDNTDNTNNTDNTDNTGNADTTNNTSNTIPPIAPQGIVIEEPTDGLYQYKSFTGDIPKSEPGKTFDIPLTWASDIIMWQSFLNVTENMIGDCVCIIVNPDIKIGKLTSDVIAGDKYINVSDQTLAIAKRGIDISIDNDVKKSNLGEILNIDYVNKTITTEYSVDSNYYISHGDVDIIYNYCMVKDKIIVDANKIPFGTKGFKGKQLKAGTVMLLRYTNNTGTAKKLCWDAEFYIVN